MACEFPGEGWKKYSSGIDECPTSAGEVNLSGCVVYYWRIDNDKDYFFVPGSLRIQSEKPDDGNHWIYETSGEDCDDDDPNIGSDCAESIPWYYDNDGDGYHSWSRKYISTPKGDKYSKTTKGKDCDDNRHDPDNDCSSSCKKRTGYLYDANFTGRTVTLGDNVTIKRDNFRNDDWGIISETNCKTGKVPIGSTVKVTSTKAITRPGTSLKYFKVEYDECSTENKEKLNCGGDPCKVTSIFGKNANKSSVNKCSLEKIKEIANRLGIDEFEISSTARDAKNQARIMYNNIVAYGVAKQKSLYGSNGDKVIDAYVTAKAKSGSTAESIKLAMLNKINELGPGKVSKHSADPNVLTVVDIKPSSISSSKRSKFVDAINSAVANGDVSRFLHPGNSTDPAYHIEINVKDCELKDCNK